MLFAINQGEFIRISELNMQRDFELELDGYAIGGLAVGESHERCIIF